MYYTNGPRQKHVLSDMIRIYLLILEVQEASVFKAPKQPKKPKAADFFGCHFVFCTDVSWTSKTKHVDKHHILRNTFFPSSNRVAKYRF